MHLNVRRLQGGGAVLSWQSENRDRESRNAMSALEQIETGSFATPGWVIFPPDSVRVVSWNIDRGLQLDKIIDFLTGAKADILLLQEADQNARRTHRTNVAREIAQKLRMNYAFGKEFQELTQGSRTSPAYHGQVTLSRWPMSNCRIIRFEQQATFWRPHWFLPEIPPFQERLGGRLALVSEVKIGDRTVVTYNVHLESKGDDRLRCAQLDQLLRDAQQYKAGDFAVICGDFNLNASNGPAADALSQAGFEDAL